MANARSDYRAVLFDAVGTLIYAEPPVVEVYHTAAKSHGVEISQAEIGTRIKSAVETRFAQRTTSSETIEHERWHAIVADVFHDRPDCSGSIFAELWRHFASPAAWGLFGDVEECMEELQSKGIAMAIASNFDARLQNVCRGHKVLRDLKIFCSSELGFAKPHRDFFRAIEAQLELPPQSLTMIGDDLEADHHGALDAGWNSLHLVREAESADGKIASLGELPALLAAK